MTMPDPANPSPARRWPWILLALVVVAGLGVAGWFCGPRETPKKADPDAAAHANARGVGLMERFEYPAAVLAFEEVVRLDPDWLPGRINLAIALLNTAEPKNIERAIALFTEVLKTDPDNP